MEMIIDTVAKAADREYERCVEEKGRFVDMHQAYAVIKEEVEEADEELDFITSKLDELWRCVRDDYPQGVDLRAQAIHAAAIRLAAEAIQVAAMCKKAKLLFSSPYGGCIYQTTNLSKSE